MILRSIILAALLIPIGLSAMETDPFPDDAAVSFERGLSVGIDSIDREYRVQGWKEEVIDSLEYMVVLNTKKCTTKKILLLKEFGFRRGLTPIELTNDLLYFKSYGSKPDAEELVGLINSAELKDNFEKAYVYKKRPGEKFNKAPFVFKYIFDAMQKEIKKDVQVLVLSPDQGKAMGIKTTPKEKVVVETKPEIINTTDHLPVVVTPPNVAGTEVPMPKEVIAPPKPIVKNIPSSPVPNKKVVTKPAAKKTILKATRVEPVNGFSMKGSVVEYYSYLSSDGASDLNLKKRKFEDRNFEVQRTLQNKGQRFVSSGGVVSINGVKYIKVKGKNMYFEAYSTTIGE